MSEKINKPGKSKKEVAKSNKKNSRKSLKPVYEDNDPDALERNDTPMSIVGHLNEMRSRLIKSLVTVTAGTLIAFFFFTDYLLNIINEPYLKTGLKLNVFTLGEGFMLRAKASLIAGIFIAIPVIIYEIWKYLEPAVNKKDRKFIGGSVVASVFLLYTGIFFTYFFLLPIAIQMLLKFTPNYMTNLIHASQYLNFALFFSLAVGILFELPIFIIILTKIGIITPKILIKKRKYAIVIIWLLSGLLTPGPDILSQTLVAIPVTLLYEVSIILSRIVVKRNNRA